jgi:TonB family protein
MKNILLLIFFCNFSTSYSQTDGELFNDNLDRLPDNIGGKLEFQRFFEAHVVYPAKALKERKQGISRLKFILLATGKITKIQVSESAGPELDNEALRLLALLEWVPAEKDGQNKNCYHAVSFNFNIDKYKNYAKVRGFMTPKFDKKTVLDTSNQIIEHPDYTAEYYKGDEALNEFVKTNLEYPQTAKVQNISGVVQLRFVVELDGKISNINIEKNVAGGCSETAIGLIGETKWKPAKYKGKIVRSRYQYAIEFSLSNFYKGNEMGEQGK